MRKPTRSEIGLYAILLALGEIILTAVMIREFGLDLRLLSIGLAVGAVAGIVAIPFTHAIRVQMLGDREDRWSS